MSLRASSSEIGGRLHDSQSTGPCRPGDASGGDPSGASEFTLAPDQSDPRQASLFYGLSWCLSYRIWDSYNINML